MKLEGTFKLESTGKTVRLGVLTGEGPAWDVDCAAPVERETYDVGVYTYGDQEYHLHPIWARLVKLEEVGQ